MKDLSLKMCKQCGEVKPLAEFRRYYSSNGTYTKCRACERINSREKYLRSKSMLSETEQTELDKIHKLWDAQRIKGLTPPRSRGKIKLDDMLKRYEVPETVPAELEAMLTTELTKDPEWYYTLYDEELMPTYRPIVGIDPETNLPKYDDSYKDVLNKILRRLDEYENEYYKED